MKAPPLLFGGCSPVVAYLSVSIIVYGRQYKYVARAARVPSMVAIERTVFPEPLYPTMRVSGVLNSIDSWLAGLKERMLEVC